MSVGGVRRFEVTEQESPVFGGTEFGAVGPYERLHGTVFGELDPTHPLNIGIINLDRAALNAHGNVESQSHFRILKPLDLARGNGCMVYERAQSRQPADHAAAQRRTGRRAPHSILP